MALIQCKHCGQPISDKATMCPKCGGHNTITLKEVFNSGWGKWFYVACALLLLNAMYSILWNLLVSNQSDLLNILISFKALPLISYYLGLISITFIIGKVFTKIVQIIIVCLCGISFILAGVLSYAIWDNVQDVLTIELINSVILVVLFIIIATQVKAPIRISILLMLIPQLCDITLLLIQFNNIDRYLYYYDTPSYTYAIYIFGNIITIGAVISLIYNARQCSKQVSKVESLPNSISQAERT